MGQVNYTNYDLFMLIYEDKKKGKWVKGSDAILSYIFDKYTFEIKDTFNISCQNSEGDRCILGAVFHKTFRQVEVLPRSELNTITWLALQDAKIFWEAMSDFDIKMGV